jgi:hypothetical protein
MMCSGRDELMKRANWEGKGIKSRTLLMDMIQQFLPPHIMLPPKRYIIFFNFLLCKTIIFLSNRVHFVII